MTKWQANGNIFSEKTWSRIFELPIKVTQETKLRWLQFQTFQRIVPTNGYLFKLNILNSSSCTFCKNYIETKEHLFYDCVHVKELWVKIEEWMLNKFIIYLFALIKYLSCLENIQTETSIDCRIYLFFLSNSIFLHLNTNKR